MTDDVLIQVRINDLKASVATDKEKSLLARAIWNDLRPGAGQGLGMYVNGTFWRIACDWCIWKYLYKKDVYFIQDWLRWTRERYKLESRAYPPIAIFVPGNSIPQPHQ